MDLQLGHRCDIAVEAAFEEVDIRHVQLDDHEEHHEEEDEGYEEGKDIKLVSVAPGQGVSTETTTHLVRGTKGRVCL